MSKKKDPKLVEVNKETIDLDGEKVEVNVEKFAGFAFNLSDSKFTPKSSAATKRNIPEDQQVISDSPRKKEIVSTISYTDLVDYAGQARHYDREYLIKKRVLGGKEQADKVKQIIETNIELGNNMAGIAIVHNKVKSQYMFGLRATDYHSGAYCPDMYKRLRTVVCDHFAQATENSNIKPVEIIEEQAQA